MESTGIQLIIELGLITVVATLLAYLAHHFKQPAVLAYLLAGVIIGPTFTISTFMGPLTIGLGLISSFELISLASSLGIAFLLFSIGVESELIQFFRSSREVILIALLQVLLTFLVGMGLLSVFSLDFFTAVYLALIVSFSSTTVIVRVLSEKSVLHTVPGRLLIAILLVQDFLIVLALPLLSVESFEIAPLAITLFKALILLVFTGVVHRYVFPRIFKWASQSHELLFLSTLSVAFIFMGISEFLGFSLAIGAFLAGLAISTLAVNLEVSSKIRGLKDFFSTIFFVSLGLQFGSNFSTIPWALFAGLIVITVFLKPLITAILLLAGGYGGKIALIVGFTLAQISEFSFILAAQGLASGYLSSEAFSAVILATTLTLVFTPHFNAMSIPFYELIKKKFGIHLEPFHANWNRKLLALFSLPTKNALKGHVVVLGAGRMGHAIIMALEKEYSVVAVDNDPEIIRELIEEGHYAIYAEVGNEELWQRLKLKDAKLLVITLPGIKESLHSLRQAREINPKITIFGRASRPADALRLYQAKIDHVVMPHTIAANIVVKEIAQFMQKGTIGGGEHFKKEFMEYLDRESKL